MRKLIIATALVVASQTGAVSAEPAPDRPTILVDGYGEVKTPPDVATIGYTLRGEGATSDEAVRAMTVVAERIEASLRHVDAAARPTTDAVRISPVRGSACKDRDYDNDDDQLSKGNCAVVGYIATQGAEVLTGKVNDAGTMVGLAGRGGAFNARLENFDLNDPRPAKRQAVFAALVDAQTKAAAVAAASHVTLGSILSIATTSRDAVRTEDLINRLPQANAIPAAERDEPVPVRLTPEPITTNATVTVTYAIMR